jgi:hypothetical protein
MSFIIELLTVYELQVVMVEIQGDLNVLTLVDVCSAGFVDNEALTWQ